MNNLKTRGKTGKGRKPRVLLIATGCAQAESIPRLVFNLLDHPKAGSHDVIVVATVPALDFFSRRRVERMTKRKVYVRHTDGTKEFPVPHINLTEWADLILIYPASANTIAKCAHGLCDSLASTIVLASRAPVYFGTTMNTAMYENPITQKNLKTLKRAGHRFIPFERATGEAVEKYYCSEQMVLRTCVEFFTQDKRIRHAARSPR